MKRIRKWFSIKKDQNARLLILSVIVLFNIGLWLVSSLIAYWIAPNQYGNIAKALWESGITWMLEPGFYDPSVSHGIRIISIIVILTSMITFTGGIIGYVASLFSSIIENARKGKGKLYIYGHILILNWNQKALELIADYRFDDDTTDVVILSSHPKEEIEEEIERKFYGLKHKQKINIIVREGEVFSKSDLMNVCIEDSKTIIILSDQSLEHKKDSGYADIHVMKTLMLVSNLHLKHDQSIIVEVKEQKTMMLIQQKIAREKTMHDQIVPILPDELMGRLIAQTILMPELSQVYHELFSFDGAEFYTVEDIKADDYIKNYPFAVPIYNLGNLLYVMTENEKNLYERRTLPLHDFSKLKIKNEERYHEQTILIFGTNSKLHYIIDSIELYKKENKTNIIIEHIDSNDAKVIEESVKNFKKIDTILILSADYLEPIDYDSDVLVTLLLIQEIAQKHHAEIVIELLDPKHFDIAQSYNIRNTIISNEYISKIFTQLSKNRKLYALYQDLLTYDPIDSTEETYEIYAYKASDIFANQLPLSFNSYAEFVYACYMSGRGNYMMIGLIKEGKLELFKGNLDEPHNFVIDHHTTIITICK
jgi:hypothetical protein